MHLLIVRFLLRNHLFIFLYFGSYELCHPCPCPLLPTTYNRHSINKKFLLSLLGAGRDELTHILVVNTVFLQLFIRDGMMFCI